MLFAVVDDAGDHIFTVVDLLVVFCGLGFYLAGDQIGKPDRYRCGADVDCHTPEGFIFWEVDGEEIQQSGWLGLIFQ